MTLQEKRKQTIQKIIKTIEKIQDQGRTLDIELLIDVLGGEGVSRRTARDYIKSAYAIIENAEQKLH